MKKSLSKREAWFVVLLLIEVGSICMIEDGDARVYIKVAFLASFVKIPKRHVLFLGDKE